MSIQILKINDITLEYSKIDNFTKKLSMVLAKAFREYLKTVDNVVKKAPTYVTEEEVYRYWFITNFEKMLKEHGIDKEIRIDISYCHKYTIYGFISYKDYIYKFDITGGDEYGKFYIYITKYRYQNELKVYN